jgi:hypothetical protein
MSVVVPLGEYRGRSDKRWVTGDKVDLLLLLMTYALSHSTGESRAAPTRFTFCLA